MMNINNVLYVIKGKKTHRDCGVQKVLYQFKPDSVPTLR